MCAPRPGDSEYDGAVLVARGPQAEPGEAEDRRCRPERAITSGWALQRLPLDQLLTVG